MNNKILAIGDSLSLPRQDVLYEDTWFYKLKYLFPEYEFISVFRRAVTTDILIEWGRGDKKHEERFPKGSDLLEFYKPDIIILQLGIVDCAPRLFKKGSLEAMLIRKLPLYIRNKYISFVKKNRNRDIKKSYVTPQKFKYNLQEYLNRCEKNNVLKIIIIGIPYPEKEMITKNPNIIKNVNLYNSIFENLKPLYKNISIIYPLNSKKSNKKIFVDGYHPNKIGHDLVLNDLQIILNEFKSN